MTNINLGELLCIKRMVTKFGNEANKLQYKKVYENGEALYSYDTLIAVKVFKKREGGVFHGMREDKVCLTPSWNYSNTTSFYRKQFLNGESITETRKKLESGEYELVA